MKKFLSFLLATALLVSAVPTALATNDYTAGTRVEYTASGSESYTITVPAQLAPGGSGTVTLSGTWADNRIVTVTADPTVTLKNSIKDTDTKILDVHFDGILEAGSNTGSQTFTESVSVDGITNALFGTWSGKFNYNVDIADAPATLGCDTLYWDGNTEGLYGVELNSSTAIPHYVAYKISDITPTASDCENGVSLYLSNGENAFIAGDEISNYFTDDGAFQEGVILIIPYDNYENMGLEKGTYFMLVTDESGSIWGSQLTINGYTGFEHFNGCPHDDNNGTTLPAGAYYLNAATGTAYSEIPATPSDYDIFLYGDYLYVYYSPENPTGWTCYLATADLELEGMKIANFIPNYDFATKDQTSYDPILEKVGNSPVTMLYRTFYQCAAMTESPVIPKYVTSLITTYRESGLSVAPNIPEGVKSMRFTFEDCDNLIEGPVLPKGLVDMRGIYEFCDNLTYVPNIPDGVVDLAYAFYQCKSLPTVPRVPASVLDMERTFSSGGYGSSLTGILYIDANPTSYHDCFEHLDFTEQNLNLAGDSIMLDELLEFHAGTHYCFECNGKCYENH